MHAFVFGWFIWFIDYNQNVSASIAYIESRNKTQQRGRVVYVFWVINLWPANNYENRQNESEMI